ncbi:hypothetical protein [Actinophytocola sp.]|uniref:hypothetical protein n=1 Tax=Actinophytocola sp. TaxID=1872138 RepID=UPI003899F11C
MPTSCATPSPGAPRDRTVYTPVGLPWQDLALARTGYRHAVSADIGHRFDFSG